MATVDIVIRYDPKAQKIEVSHPTDVVLTFGILERAKLAIAAKTTASETASNSGVVGARSMPGPGFNGRK